MPRRLCPPLKGFSIAKKRGVPQFTLVEPLLFASGARSALDGALTRAVQSVAKAEAARAEMRDILETSAKPALGEDLTIHEEILGLADPSPVSVERAPGACTQNAFLASTNLGTHSQHTAKHDSLLETVRQNVSGVAMAAAERQNASGRIGTPL